MVNQWGGGENVKRIIAIIMVVLTVVSFSAFSASAQTYFWLGTNSYSYNGNKYCYVKLKKPGRTNAKVTVRLTSTGPLSIKMTNGNGRYLWSEDYSIKPNGWCTGARTYSLGKNNSSYRLYFKSTNGIGTGSCNVTNPKNCSIS